LFPVVEQLYERAHEYANLANRSGPLVTDLQLACEDFKLPKALRSTGTKNTGKNKKSQSEIFFT
jgi:transcription initiation factor TFIID subunit 8